MEERFELIFERRLAAPPDVVFRAWTEIEHVREWITCGEGHAAAVERWDGTAGGRLHVRIIPHGAGESVDLSGAFLVVDAPSILVYEWGPGLVRVECRPVGSGTALRVSYAGPGPRDQLERGWDEGLTRMTRLLDNTAIAEAEGEEMRNGD